ncbi:MAG: tetratricopeptide repeat protein [Comamonadaceae bacterium]|nr:tetratricopeptide repeat protein [Comamonadaceae bacterium]
MASNYDLQEQEQIALIKHFWNRWGTLISSVALAIVLAVAAYNGWNYWKTQQAGKAAELFDQVALATQQNQSGALAQSLEVLQSSFPGTAQASQASLLAGKYWVDQQDWPAAEKAFDWVQRNSQDEGFKALAVLRKAAVHMQQKQWDAALAALDAYNFPYEYRALRDDRRGDILQEQGKTQEAIAAYQAAFAGLDAFTPYRSVVEAKLNALGQNPAKAG